MCVVVVIGVDPKVENGMNMQAFVAILTVFLTNISACESN